MIKLPVDYNALTPAKRKQVRTMYCELQNWKCAHCGNNLMSKPSEKIVNTPLNLKLFPFGFLKFPIHLHHNHRTGMTIGAIHARCNGILWQYHNE